MNTYTFLKANQTNQKDMQTLRAMVEAFFHTHDDPEQMQIGKGTRKNWIQNEIPECAIMIKSENEVVGCSLILPATVTMMQDFISCRINEAQLAAEIEAEMTYEKMQAIYLCSAFVTAEHRGKNLAIQALVQSIQTIMPKDQKLPLFYWAYSEAGKKLTEKVATQLGLELFARKA